MDECEILTIDAATSARASREPERVVPYMDGDRELWVPPALKDRAAELDGRYGESFGTVELDSEGEFASPRKVHVALEFKGTDDNGEFDMVGSDESVDRDGDIIRVSGWDLKAYKKNPVLLWGHKHAEPPIGIAKRVTKNRATGQLEFRLRWATDDEFAQRIRALFDARILRASSVGFIPLKWKIPSTPEEREELGLGPYGIEFLKQELMELSIVSVPSNRNALAASIGAALATGKATAGMLRDAHALAGSDDPVFMEIERAYCELARAVVATTTRAVTQDNANGETANDGGGEIVPASVSDELARILINGEEVDPAVIRAAPVAVRKTQAEIEADDAAGRELAAAMKEYADELNSASAEEGGGGTDTTEKANAGTESDDGESAAVVDAVLDELKSTADAMARTSIGGSHEKVAEPDADSNLYEALFEQAASMSDANAIK